MNCIIIDDDATARLIISQLCEKSEWINVLAEFSSAINAIKYLNSNTVDLVYLDIHMPTFSGFDFIQTLKNPPKIILTTSDKNLALEAFEYKSVIDYLVKPISKERFNKSLEKLKIFSIEEENASLESKKLSDYIYVNVDKRLVKINIPSIYLIEAKGDYINIKTNIKNYLVHSTLKKIEDKLPSNMFFRVHRSFVINFSEIVDIEDNTVLVKQDIVPISRSLKSELIRKLNRL
ncbi:MULTISPECIES: LytTR family DNA-binding domain-containing protein [unclassified Polaribacter]|jgi:DNA-binding LytR/AlgR family response regulator|uniref:LytR/AlgR family response regulator transcription factor n=1 Tax=unclassified Polaribacter TaxID=196858 RepID=UPI000C7091B5|nr:MULTISPECIES: LytTR family DNA-binding domain-containing protein [unclassified Polaribacter]MDG1404269.1 LytTR family DNA-binding domain-containing protein [Polaribacter sp.]PKV66246.1 LytTR family two component transcriptional regulator [Polaribacter sp. Hel1_33_96]